MKGEFSKEEHCRKIPENRPVCDSLKNYAVALLIGFGLGTAGWFYVPREFRKEQPPHKVELASNQARPIEPEFKYFCIEAMADGAGYDISKPSPPNRIFSVYHVVVKNKRSGGTIVECRRPIDADAIEGLLACIEQSLKSDHRADYDPPEYKALIERLPDMDVSGDAKTITRADVSRAYDRATGGLKAIIGK